MFLTPPTVFTRIGKNAEMNTMKTFDHMPMPNQMMIIGTMAMRGVAYRAFRNGSKISRTRSVPADDHAQRPRPPPAPARIR